MALYENPQFVDNQAPALNATNMNNLANSAVHSQSYELAFTLSNDTYADASATDKQNHTNYWDNQNIVVTGTQGTSSPVAVTINNYATFKDAVNDVEGTYAFTFTVVDAATSYWSIDGVQIASTIGNYLSIPEYGITFTENPFNTADYRTASIVLTFDAYKEQKVTVAGLTAQLSGSVGVAQTATKAQYDAAAYGQLRCISQGQGFLTIASYGVTPTIDIPCVVTVDSDGQVIYG